MPDNANVILTRCEVVRGSTICCMARVVDTESSAYITQANVSTVTYTITLLDEDYPDDPNNDSAVSGHSAVALTKTACVYDTLQTGAPWTKDSTGFNFKHVIDVSTNPAFAIAGRSYRVQVTITPVSGQRIDIPFKAEVI